MQARAVAETGAFADFGNPTRSGTELVHRDSLGHEQNVRGRPTLQLCENLINFQKIGFVRDDELELEIRR